MCHTALLDAKFHAFLLDIDEDLAAETRARACRRCGSRLHRDRYPRNPRGRSRNLVEAYRHRLSFTCSICDKRHTPASVRFVGRRVYLAVAVVLTSAVRTGLTDWRVSRLTERILVPKRTVDRSRRWWLLEFVPVLGDRARPIHTAAGGRHPAGQFTGVFQGTGSAVTTHCGAAISSAAR